MKNAFAGGNDESKEQIGATFNLSALLKFPKRRMMIKKAACDDGHC
jgi:hypothetical protein